MDCEVGEVTLPQYVLAEPHGHRSSAGSLRVEDLNLPAPDRDTAFRVPTLHHGLKFRLLRAPLLNGGLGAIEPGRDFELRALHDAELF